MDTKPSLQKDNIKQQDAFTPDGYIRPNAATVVKSETGGSCIVDFDYDKYAEVERKATNTNAVAGLTLGILSIAIDWFMAIIGLVLGIAGIVFSVMGRKEKDGAGIAAAGLICSIIGVILSVVAMILFILALGTFIGSEIYI